MLLLCAAYSAQAQVITTVAGNGTAGFFGDYGPATAAELLDPRDGAVDDSGNLYIADADNYCVRKVLHSGIIITVAGIGGASGVWTDSVMATDTYLGGPVGVVVDHGGNLYIADAGTRICKVDTAGILTIIAGNGTIGYGGDNGPAKLAALNNANGLTVDKHGNIYIADASNYRIRRIDTSGTITTIAGTGISGFNGDNILATTANVYPMGITVDTSGNLYFTDSGVRVRKINTAGIISTIAGIGVVGFYGDGGMATLAQFNSSVGIKRDRAGNIFIGDVLNYRVRKIDTGGVITTIAGTDSAFYNGDHISPLAANINSPFGLTVDSGGNIFITDANERIRKVGHDEGVVRVIPDNDVVMVAPNPSKGMCTVAISGSTNEAVTLSVRNVTGEEVAHIATRTGQPTILQLDVADGVYYLYATTASKILVHKIVIVK